MTAIGIADFSGMLPLRDPVLLPVPNSQFSYNTWLYKGAVRGYRYSDPVFTATRSTSRQVWRIPTSDINVYDWVDSIWLEFPDPFIIGHQSPIVGDEFNRYYFFPSDQFVPDAGNWPQVPFYAPVSNFLSETGPYYVLGIPAPERAPSLDPADKDGSQFALGYSPPGNNTITMHPISFVTVGMTVDDQTLFNNNVHTNAASAIGSDTLSFASTSAIFPDSEVLNGTTPSSITVGTTTVSVGSTTIFLSAPISSPGVALNDSINFFNIDPVPAGTTVTAVDHTTNTITISNNLIGAGVGDGDNIYFTAGEEARSYVYTYVSAYNEEGPPSPPTLANGGILGTWTVIVYSPSAPQLDGSDLGVPNVGAGRNLVSINIYRTVSDNSGNAVFYLVGNVPITTPGAGITFQDSALDTDITNNLALPSTYYSGPPPGLQGVVAMANGIWAGWTNEREIWFSAAFLPHAWPSIYALTVDYPVVGLSAIGSSLNIHTEGQPFIATGTTPDTITIGKITANEPCVSRGSIFAAGEGSYYASPNGLILLNTSGTINVTQFSMEREFWNSLNPATWASGRIGITYIAYNMGVSGPSPTIAGIAIDHLDKNVPCSYLGPPLGLAVKNLYWDERSSQMFTFSSDLNVRWLFPFTGNLLPWVFKSKKFRFPFPEKFKAFKIHFEVPPEVTITPPTPASRDVSQSQVFNPATQYLIVRIYADGVQVLVQEVVTSGEALMIPGGYKATYWEIQFEGQIYLFLFKMASSVKELRKE